MALKQQDVPQGILYIVFTPNLITMPAFVGYRLAGDRWMVQVVRLRIDCSAVQLQIWTVPRTATYTFQIAGGQGGTSFRYRNVGGSGDSFTVAVRLPISTKVYLVVGQTAVEAPSASSGGGASLVWVAPGSQAPVLLAVAGG